MDDRKPQAALALLERAKSGDRDAFGQLAEEHRQALFRICHKMTGSNEDAEDLVQETLLKAFQRIEAFEMRSALSTWLFRIATNVCLDHQRGKKPWDLDKRWQWFRDNGELVKQVEQQTYLSPERWAEVKEVAATCVNCVMMSLPQKQRATIVLCDQIGLSREEAAKAIGASVASVKTELHRARKTMTEVYEHHCALVDEQNECDGCLVAGRVQRAKKDHGSAPSNIQPPTSNISSKYDSRDDASPPSPHLGEGPGVRAEPTPNVAPDKHPLPHLTQELLSDFLDGELSEGVHAGVEAHLASCETCAAPYHKFKRTVRFVRANASTPLVPGTPGGEYLEFNRALMVPGAQAPEDTRAGRFLRGEDKEHQS